LRDREDDVVLLAQYFLAQLNQQENAQKRFSQSGLARLESHPWPGNVRELKNAVHRAFILADEVIGEDCLPINGTEKPVTSTRDSELEMRVGMSIADVEKRLILHTLDSFGRNMKRTAEVLGISLKTLYNRLNEYKRAAGSEREPVEAGADSQSTNET
jgi:DNA-binding NtrC family response regulator